VLTGYSRGTDCRVMFATASARLYVGAQQIKIENRKSAQSSPSGCGHCHHSVSLGSPNADLLRLSAPTTDRQHVRLMAFAARISDSPL
jgi:cytochrome c553